VSSSSSEQGVEVQSVAEGKSSHNLEAGREGLDRKVSTIIAAIVVIIVGTKIKKGIHEKEREKQRRKANEQNHGQSKWQSGTSPGVTVTGAQNRLVQVVNLLRTNSSRQWATHSISPAQSLVAPLHWRIIFKAAQARPLLAAVVSESNHHRPER
jgi:hypothetical protein